MESRVHGPPFEAGDFSWRILLFPEGNRSDSVSIYLEASPLNVPEQTDQAEKNENEDNDWHVCAQFGLVMWNPEDSSILHLNMAQHRFNPDESDWGFTKFFDLRKLVARAPNKNMSLLENNRLNITAYVRVIKDPTGVLWHNFMKYDSKKETGFVGLKNQGATCYLNSLLQSLYFTKAFRQAVYKIPTENDNPESVPLALQRMFYLLRTAKLPVGTLDLTKSFGWDTVDAFTQHDVQELNRVLMDNLEGKMKETAVDGALNKIFVAQMKSYVKCVNVDFESSRSEDYWDIQLNVKGMKDIMESFRDYIQEETLDGENQYQATGYGLQDAKKGVVFQSFPPVLHLQLKRYEYDFNRDMMVKINDRYEFPTEMDLSSFLEEGSDMSEPWEYELHGVLVHSGDLNAGHYYALLKPTKNGHWYKFDDDRVTRATMKEVLEENFGGETNSNQYPPLRNPNRFHYKRHSSAYMLVYIRKSRLDEILSSQEDEIPSHIPKLIEQEVLDEQARRKAVEEQHFYMNVRLLSNRQFEHFRGFDLGQWDVKNSGRVPEPAYNEAAKVEELRLRKDLLVTDLLQKIAEAYDVEDVSKLRLWTLVTRQNKTFRLDSLVSTVEPITLEELRSKTLARTSDLCLWLEDVEPENADEPSDEDKNSLVFLKYFDPFTQVLTGVCTKIIKQHDKVGSLAQHLVRSMGWGSKTPIRLLEEVKPEMVEVIDPKLTFEEAEISDGDIICFEKVYTPEESEEIKGYKTALEYYDFMVHRIMVTFKRRPPPLDQSMELDEDDSFDMWVNRKMGYDDMAAQVAERLNVDATHLRFFTTNVNGLERGAIRRNSGANIHQILSYAHQLSNVVLYEVLDFSLAELEAKRMIHISWLTDGLSQEHKHEILVQKSATMREVVAILKEKANIQDEVIPKIKIWGAVNSRMYRMFNDTYPVISIPDEVQIYATLCPSIEYEFINSEVMPTDRRLIFIVHFQKDPTRTHGVPFTFVLIQGEKFSETKSRLQKTLGIYDKIFDKIKFAVIKNDSYAPPVYVEDLNVELFSELEGEDVLGLDHVDKTVRRGYGQQSAIFIKN